MMMQVDLKTATSSSTSTPLRGAVESAQSVRTRKIIGESARRHPFPEAALISTRPLRYNIQLNQQLTAVQQADGYLAETETQLLRLRQAVHQRAEVPDRTTGLQRLLNQRAALSGGTVDRHFNVSLQQNSQVNFSLLGSEKLLQNPAGETLIFALAGGKRDLAAVTLPQEGEPQQVLMRLNIGLGRMGIHARLEAQGKITFSVDEQYWERVSQHLSVRGEGQNYPADSFTLLVAQPERTQQEGLAQLAAQPGNRRYLFQLRDSLEQITSQRGKLRIQQERVRLRIEDMVTPYTPQQAGETARALAYTLEKSAESFTGLSRALSAQANIHLATVKNLLG